MKLGFLTAPFPETPLMEVADWAAGSGFEWEGGSAPVLLRGRPAGRAPRVTRGAVDTGGRYSTTTWASSMMIGYW